MITTIDKALVGLLTSGAGMFVAFGVLEEGTAQQIVSLATPILTAVATYIWPNK